MGGFLKAGAHLTKPSHFLGYLRQQRSGPLRRPATSLSLRFAHPADKTYEEGFISRDIVENRCVLYQYWY